MAPIAREVLTALAATTLLAAGAVRDAHGAGTAQIGTPGGKIKINASSLEFDNRTQQSVLRDVSAVQGDLSITADRADVAGLNESDSRWTFTGKVHISSGQHGNLSSDRATVEVRNGLIQSALATGHPAEFEQTASKTGVLARGHANSIEYTVATGAVRLTQDAWLKYGDNREISAEVLVYNIRDQKLQAASAAGPGGRRVHITIPPTKRQAGSKP